MTVTENAAPRPQSAIFLAVCLCVLFVAEVSWHYNWHRSNEELSVANLRRAGQNTIDERKILELRSATVRIDGLYLRLHSLNFHTANYAATRRRAPQQCGADGDPGFCESGSHGGAIWHRAFRVERWLSNWL